MAAFVDVARHYRLPVWGTGGNSDSKVVDQQAAIESTFSCVMSGLSGAHMVHDPGYIESGMTASHEMLVMTDEIISMVYRVLRGIPMDDEHMAIDVIKQVGPQGHFIDASHTLKHFRNEQWRPTLLDRNLYDSWKRLGERDLGQRLNERVLHILHTHQPQRLPRLTLDKIRAHMQRAEDNRQRSNCDRQAVV
jgi:trimethylamine--corrinoid protein Co-methyltransferase